MLDDGPQACGFGAQDRAVADDRHLFLERSHLELEIDARLLTCGQEHTLTAQRLESRELDIEPVLARGQAGRRVDAFLGGHDDPLEVGPQRRDRDGRTGSGRPSLVPHDAGDFPGGRLGSCGHDRGGESTTHGEAD